MTSDDNHAATPQPGARLERALELFLAEPASDPATGDSLLTSHPELRDLLEPMIAGSSEVDLSEEDRLLGDYRLLEEIGRGGMGVVYAAWQRSLDRKVAVKVLAPALVANSGAVARFRREAAAAGRLRHPNIVEIYGFGSSNDRHFFAMELVEGESLSACMARFASPAAAIALATQLTAALVHAHTAGLVHRDVKPANILLRHDGSIALTDFGVASDARLPSLTQEGSFLGTIDYAAPEHIRSGAIDARCDVWAVGVILHELLASEHPFRSATQQTTIQRILTEEPTLRHQPDISDDLAAVVSCAMEKDPQRRYATAEALLLDLRALQNNAPVSARLPTRLERCSRWIRREPWRALVAAVLLAGLPLLGGLLAYLWTNSDRITTAKAAEAAEHREQILTRTWWHYHEGNAAKGLAELANTIEHDSEINITRAVMNIRLGQHAAARQDLLGVSGATAELVRAHIDDQQAAIDTGDAATLDDFECFVRAALLLEHTTRDGGHDPAILRQALTWIQRANALAKAPRPPYVITLASAAQELGDDAIAMVAERALARHFPNSRVARRVRARSLAHLQPETALALLDANKDQPQPGASILRGIAYETLNRLDEAVAANRDAIREQPNNARAWTNLGLVLRKLQQHAESETALLHATELEPLDVFAWNALGLTLRSQRKNQDAQRAFERAMELRPDYSPAAYNLGNLLKTANDLPGAIAAFEQAVRGDPNDVRSVANLGDVLLRSGRKQEALPQFLRATLLAPKDLIPQYNLARTALELNLPELALPAAQRAALLDPQGCFGNWVLADALMAQPTVDTSAARIAAAAADTHNRGNDPSVRLSLAKAMLACGERTAAIALLNATTTDQRFAGHKNLADIQQELQSLRAAK